jgi:hypothetical protein
MKHRKFFLLAFLIYVFYLSTVVVKYQLSFKGLPLLIHPFKITPVFIAYPLLQFREFIQSMYIFGDQDTCNWYLTLADKRTVEAKYFESYQQSPASSIQLNLAISYQNKSQKIIELLTDKTDINYLLQKKIINEDNIKSLSQHAH